MRATRATVTDAATELATNPIGGQPRATTLHLANTGANPADLGGADVTSGNGYALAAGATTTITIPPGDTLHAICGATLTTTIQVLQPGA